jgi:LTXXQ motif family protein
VNSKFIRLLAGSVALGALFLVPEASAARFGGGGHFGGGGLHFGGGGGHFGGGRFGGMHFGGAHFGGMHFGGGRFGGIHSGRGHFSGAHFGGARSAHFGHSYVGRIGGAHNLAGGTNRFGAHTQLGVANRFGGANQFARGQVGGRSGFGQFRGFNNFNRNGFNRNAFGNQAAWNNWGGRFWGAGWNNWGWGGWTGPVFWPFLYGDIFSFAFWPYGYYNPFWAYGPNFILASIFWPGPYFGPNYAYGGYGPDYGSYGYDGLSDIYGSNAGYYDNDAGYAYRGHRHIRHARATLVTRSHYTGHVYREAAEQTRTEVVQTCGSLAPGVTDLPIYRIQQAINPTGDQVTALNDLKSASSRANAIVRGSCPNEIPLTPVGRLDAAAKRLEAMIQAVQIVRSPLETFYNSLSDEQRRRFDALGAPDGAGTTRGPSGTGERALAPGSLASLCSPQAGGFAKLPVQRIEQMIEPNGQQQNALDELKKASAKAADELQASCPTEMPQTPIARLDAVQKRLDTMIHAISTIRPTLDTFYASLSDEQKARFNLLGRRQNDELPRGQITGRQN